MTKPQRAGAIERERPFVIAVSSFIRHSALVTRHSGGARSLPSENNINRRKVPGTGCAINYFMPSMSALASSAWGVLGYSERIFVQY